MVLFTGQLANSTGVPFLLFLYQIINVDTPGSFHLGV